MQSLISGHCRCRRDDGQMLPWMALILLVGFGLAVFAARFGPILDESARARTAADASALAGAAEGRGAAEKFAELNQATLTAYVRTSQGVRVTVRVGRATATAQAAASVVWVPNAAARRLPNANE